MRTTQSTAEIIAQLETGNEWACHEVSKLSPRAKHAVVPALKKVLSAKKWKGDYDLLTAAATAVYEIGPVAKDTAPLLVTQVIDGRGGMVPTSAMHALISIGKVAVPSIVKGMKSSRATEFSLARFSIALKHIGSDSSSAIPALKTLSRNKDFNLSLWSSIALAHLDHGSLPDTKVIVKAARNSKQPYPQFHAILALGQLPSSANTASFLKGLLERIENFMLTNCDASARLNSASKDSALAFFKSNVPGHSFCAWVSTGIALFRLERKTEWMPFAKFVVDDPDRLDNDVLVEAIQALGNFGRAPKRSIKKIESLVSHYDKAIGKAAKKALTQLK